VKLERLKRYYKPSTVREKEALQSVYEHVGTYSECNNCKRCVAACECINVDYDALLSLATDK
jgi:ferredoxin